MPASFSFGKFQFEVSPGKDLPSPPPEPESPPFLLLVMGDFSGRANRGVMNPLDSSQPIRIDCDNWEPTLKQLGGALYLSGAEAGDGSEELRLSSLEDFHPDRLVQQVSTLSSLLRAQGRLKDPATAAAALVEVQELLGTGSLPTTPTPAPASAKTAESAEDTLARLMGKSSAPATVTASPTGSSVDVNALIKNIIAPSVIATATPEQAATLAALEMELARRLRSVLHHPEFQKTEAAWRALDRLVREFGGEENIQLWILDVSKAELATDLQVENLQTSGLFKALGEKNWTILAGLYCFEAAVEEVELLGRIGKVAAALQAPFVAAASATFVGADSLANHPHPDQWTQRLPAEILEAWSALRKIEEAAYLGLTVPRVLLRQPYGKGSDPIESFPFEELTGEWSHEDYLWGNGSMVAAFVLTEGFRADGWEMTAGGPGELDDLPVHKFQQQGEPAVKPCAEVWLSERAGERIQQNGLMPLLSIKGQGAVRLTTLQSIAEPNQPLAVRAG